MFQWFKDWLGAFFNGWKAVLVTCVGGLIVLWWQATTDFVTFLMDYALDFCMRAAEGNEITAQMATFQGVTAWWIENLRIPECLAVWLNVIYFKWMLRKIPFIRW